MSNPNNPIEFRLEFSNDRSQPYMWLVYTKGGVKKLAYSETYRQRQGAINAVHSVQTGSVTYEVFQSSADWHWYFHIKGLNGEILARSAFKYTTRAAASADKELIRLYATSAPFYDYAKAA